MVQNALNRVLSLKLGLLILELKSMCSAASDTDALTYKFRLSFRVGKALAIDRHELPITVGGRALTLRPDKVDAPIADHEWLAIMGGGFETEDAARGFGMRLQHAL